jgi:Domain of unknown function (DUF3825)
MTPHHNARWLFRRVDSLNNVVVDRGLAFVPDIEMALESLADMAADEDWGPDRGVLRNYLDCTVHRLISENKVTEAVDDRGEPVASFCTGLLTPDTQSIYAFLTRNRNALDAAQEWFVTRWAVASDTCMRFCHATRACALLAYLAGGVAVPSRLAA